MKTNDIRLSLGGPALAGLRENMDSSVRRTLSDMMARHVNEAVVTSKLVIRLDPISVSRGDLVVEKQKPSFKYDVTSVLTIKDKESGKRKVDEALVWDDEIKDWVLRSLDDDQTSLFDDEDYEDIVEQGETDYIGIPQGKLAMLAEPQKTEHIMEQDMAFVMLKQFIGTKLEVVELNGAYEIHTLDGRMVVSSALSKENPFYCDPKKVKPHVGHSVYCVAYGDDELVNISIECEDCNAVLYDLDACCGTEEAQDEPDEIASDDFNYDDPEE